MSKWIALAVVAAVVVVGLIVAALAVAFTTNDPVIPTPNKPVGEYTLEASAPLRSAWLSPTTYRARYVRNGQTGPWSPTSDVFLSSTHTRPSLQVDQLAGYQVEWEITGRFITVPLFCSDVECKPWGVFQFVRPSNNHKFGGPLAEFDDIWPTDAPTLTMSVVEFVDAWNKYGAKPFGLNIEGKLETMITSPDNDPFKIDPDAVTYNSWWSIMGFSPTATFQSNPIVITAIDYPGVEEVMTVIGTNVFVHH
jgi:hypothetical protein